MASLTLSSPLDATHRLLSRGRVQLLVHREWEVALPVQAMLDGAPLTAWGPSVPHRLSGRGPVHVLSTPRGAIVAKQLQRGGLVGGVFRRSFFDAQRPLREAEAAELLQRRGVRTPTVVAARITRLGLGLRLELATAREGEGIDLLEAARSGLPLPLLARALGRTLREAHAAGLRHRDLQVKNLCLPAGAAGPAGLEAPQSLVILDLDRCSVGEPLDESERRAALTRLGRSLVKRGVLPGPVTSARDTHDTRRPALWACRDFVRAYVPQSRDAARLLASLRRGLELRLRARPGLGRGVSG